MEYSKIFLDLSSFINLQNKFVIQLQNNEKKHKKNKRLNTNQTSFILRIIFNKLNRISKKNEFFKIEFICYFSYFFFDTNFQFKNCPYIFK